MDGTRHIRIARPTKDLTSAERFWAEGLGMDVLFRAEARHPAAGGEDGEGGGESESDGRGEQYALLMTGWQDAGWHLEFALDPHAPVAPAPTDEDLLVIYLDGPVPEGLVERLERCGGTRVPARNPYWEKWGVTVRDPDGYRLVLSTRHWSSKAR
jgi:catechol 2,3-dioxygenase-like lactoylglutathione lyase family enzyme